MLDLESAIKHAEEAAKRNEEYAKIHARGDEFEQEDAFKCEECAKEHRQLAEWLKELDEWRKGMREATQEEREGVEQYIDGIAEDVPDTNVGEYINREDALMCLTGEWTELTDEIIHRFIKRIKNLPLMVLPKQRTGRWIPTGYDGYADGNPVYDWWECSECGGEHTGDEDTLTPYCPTCGAKMEVEAE